jgi:gamma-glutamylcysteine synthetase
MLRVRKVRKKQARWEVIRLKASPAVFVGLVDAPDEATAKKTAIKQFKIKQEHQKALLVRRA